VKIPVVLRVSLKINSADGRHRILAHDAGSRLNSGERHCCSASFKNYMGLEPLGYEAEPWQVTSAEIKLDNFRTRCKNLLDYIVWQFRQFKPSPKMKTE
jgi:hypothetical protein